MSKELDTTLININNEGVVYVYKECWNEIQKEHQALEIIKKKVNFTEAKVSTNKKKQKCLVMVVLDNEEEYDLLKEVLL